MGRTVKFLRWLAYNIRIEPAIFLFNIYVGVNYTIVQPFLYWRFCLDSFRDKVDDLHEFCRDLSNSNDTKFADEIDAAVDTFGIYLAVASCIPALLFSLLIGAWSDGSGGRKRPLLLACGGAVVKQLIYLLCIIGEERVNVYWLVAANAISSATGDRIVFNSCALSLVTEYAQDNGEPLDDEDEPPDTLERANVEGLLSDSEVEDEEEAADVAGEDEEEGLEDGEGNSASVRLGVASGLTSLGIVGGSLVCASLKDLDNRSSYIWATLSAELGAFLAAAYIFIRLPADGGDGEAVHPVELMKQAMGTVTRRRPGWRRFAIIMSLETAASYMAFYYSLDNILLLIVKKPPFNWSDSLFFYGMAIQLATGAVSVLILPTVPPPPTPSPSHWESLELISKCVREITLGMDILMLVIGLVFAAGYFVFLALSTSSVMIFSAFSLLLAAELVEVGKYGLFSKIVDFDEICRMFMVLSLVETGAPMVGTAVANTVYTYTMGFWPGLPFIVAAASIVPQIPLLGLIYYLVQEPSPIKHSRLDEEEDVETIPGEVEEPSRVTRSARPSEAEPYVVYY